MLVGVLLAIAAPSRADDVPTLRLPTMIFATAAAVDWTTTAVALNRGSHENNPTVQWAQAPGAMIAIGAAEDVLGAWLWTRAIGRRHPKLAAAGLYAAAAVRVSFAIHNLRSMR